MEGTGIIRTLSGRETYAPDGLQGGLTHESSFDTEPSSRTVSEGDMTYAPIQPKARDNSESTFAASRRQSYSSIHPSEHDVLTRLATQELSRQDTLVNLEYNDPSLDPNDKSFDLYKWLRKFVHGFDAAGVRAVRAGVVFKNLDISGSGAALQLQQTVASTLLSPFRDLSFGSKPHKQILTNFNGTLRSGELLIVLGRPGSGCTTFLKSLCGELSGLEMNKASEIHYNGIPQKQMLKEFKGEVVYNQEGDKHFPHLTVGQTLEFAASARTPSSRIENYSRKEWAQYVAKVIMAVFGLSHTYNTKVGNDFIRGVSGGERKRVSIAEMAVSGSPLGAWDNSTRGLDSATALKFVQSLRLLADLA